MIQYINVKDNCFTATGLGVYFMSKNLDMAYLIDIYGSMLTDKQKDALELYYFEDLSLSEIAENMQISRQGVRDSIKRGEETLLELENSLGHLWKMRKYNEIISNIKEQNALMLSELKKISYTRGVQSRCEALISYLDECTDLFGEN